MTTTITNLSVRTTRLSDGDWHVDITGPNGRAVSVNADRAQATLEALLGATAPGLPFARDLSTLEHDRLVSSARRVGLARAQCGMERSVPATLLKLGPFPRGYGVPTALDAIISHFEPNGSDAWRAGFIDDLSQTLRCDIEWAYTAAYMACLRGTQAIVEYHTEAL